MITADQVSQRYGKRTVVDQVSLKAPHGQVLGLVGPNGSGKTTLLRTLYGSLKPAGGTVLIDGASLSTLNARDVARRLSVVVQESASEMPLLVSDMVLLGRTPHQSAFSHTTAADEQIAAHALSQVGALHLATQPFDGLSGGERQRVLIARALAQGAEHLLLDEPTNHLDVRFQHEVLALARDLAITAGHTVIVVLHDLNLAATYCDQVMLLNNGVVVANGSPDEVLTPAILEPVYQVNVRRLEVEDGFQLMFRPRPRPVVEHHHDGFTHTHPAS